MLPITPHRINSLIENETGLKSTYRPPALRALHERDPSITRSLSSSREGSVAGDSDGGEQEILVGIGQGIGGGGDLNVGDGGGAVGSGFRRARAG